MSWALKSPFAEIFAKGGEGGNRPCRKRFAAPLKTTRLDFRFLYDEKASYQGKDRNYRKGNFTRADGANYTTQANKAIAEIERLGFT